jgi:signal transduction histidine kinase
MPAEVLSMYDELPDAALVVDAEGLVTAANPAAVRLLGEVVGLPFTAIGLRDAEGREWWACEAAARAMAGVRAVPERRLLLPRDRAVLLTATYARTAGRFDHAVIAVRDTRARERIERQHADLISTVAHELRSPLTSVKGFTATMLARWDRFGDEQKKQMLEWINNDADRVTRLLAELLDVSRIDSGRVELHTQVVDLAALSHKIVAGRVASGEPVDRFAIVTEGETPEMWLDPDKIEQVLGNLVENALRHGAGAVKLTIMALPDGAEVLVDDEGEGVDPGVAPRIFSKFYRGKASRGGTGLGLYIVRGMVEAHGGTVAVESRPGGGARFRFRLPAGAPPHLA